MCSAERRGFSLVEILVACVLFLMVGTLVFQVVIPMARGTVRGNQQMDLQQTAALTMGRLCEDLQTSAAQGIYVSPATGSDPLIVSIHPLRAIDSLGDQVWDDRLIVYWWMPGDGRLWRTTWPHESVARAPGSDEPFRPTLAELRSIVALDNRWRRVQANHVSDFGLDPLAIPCLVKLTLESASPDASRPESFSLQRAVALRNERS